MTIGGNVEAPELAREVPTEVTTTVAIQSQWTGQQAVVKPGLCGRYSHG